MEIEMQPVGESGDEAGSDGDAPLYGVGATGMVRPRARERKSAGRRVLKYVVMTLLVLGLVVAALVAGVVLGQNWDSVFRNECSFSFSSESVFAAERFHLDPRATERSFRVQREIHETLHWAAVIESAHFANHIAPGSSDELYFAQCIQDTHWLRMFSDERCTHAWQRKLAWETPVAIRNVLAVITDEDVQKNAEMEGREYQNGGAEMVLGDGTKAYFKPCWGNAVTMESYTDEIVAFHIDRILGVYRTPAVVPREFPADQLLRLAEERQVAEADPEVRARWAMETILEHCGTEDGSAVLGGLVGLSPFELRSLEDELLESYMYQFEQLSDASVRSLMNGEFDISSDSPPEERIKPLESVALYIFDSLIGYQRSATKHMFVATAGNQTGPFVYVDNDRAQWVHSSVLEESSAPQMNCAIAEATVGTLCKFPRALATRLLLLSPNKTAGAMEMFGDEGIDGTTLGKMLFNSTRAYTDVEFQRIMFSCEEAEMIDRTVEFWSTVIDRCIEQHGEEFVLIEEPWKRTFDFYEQTAPSWGRALQEEVAALHDAV